VPAGQSGLEVLVSTLEVLKMKAKHFESYRLEAWEALKLINASVGQDFHTLSSSQVDKLLEMADSERYQKPKNANGSRARYYYARLQRHAALKGGK
jgi:hypothetical protein